MDALLIQARNQRVKSSLQEAYAQTFLPDKLPVFRVDNASYQEQDFPQAIALSGIPELRRYCLSLPGRALFRSAHAHLEHQLPTLVDSVEIWLDAAQKSGTETFSSSLSVGQTRDQLDTLLQEWQEDFDNNIKEGLQRPWSMSCVVHMSNLHTNCTR